MKIPNSKSATANAAAGTEIASIPRRTASPNAGVAGAAGATAAGTGVSPAVTVAVAEPRSTPTLMRRLVSLADDALDQIIHLLELDIRLLALDAGRDDDLAGVVLQRS